MMTRERFTTAARPPEQLILAGPGGARSCSWESYAALRSQVRHLLEADQSSGRFRALDVVEKTAAGGPETVDAVRLRIETLQARSALARVRERDESVLARPSAQLAEFLDAVLSLTRRAVAGERLVVRCEPSAAAPP